MVAIGVYAERCEVHMGLAWIKAITLKAGPANVIGHVDRVLGMLAAGVLDPAPLVTHHLPLEDAPEAYAIYDRREALKIVLAPYDSVPPPSPTPCPRRLVSSPGASTSS